MIKCILHIGSNRFTSIYLQINLFKKIKSFNQIELNFRKKNL